MTDTFRALCAELLAALEVWEDSQNQPLIDRARAALAEPEGPPKNCWLDDEPDLCPSRCVFDDPSERIENCTYASILSARGKPKEECKYYRTALAEGAGVTRPIPVAERPWEREGFCDAEGRCWVFYHSIGVLVQPDSSLGDAVCLPAAAIPLPEASP